MPTLYVRGIPGTWDTVDEASLHSVTKSSSDISIDGTSQVNLGFNTVPEDVAKNQGGGKKSSNVMIMVGLGSMVPEAFIHNSINDQAFGLSAMGLALVIAFGYILWRLRSGNYDVETIDLDIPMPRKKILDPPYADGSIPQHQILAAGR